MKKLDDLFRNPPKGGNAAGVSTANPMTDLPGPQIQPSVTWVGGGGASTGFRRAMRESVESTPAAQTSIMESFEAGEMSARNGALQSGRVGQADLRNFDRGSDHSSAGEPIGAYANESAQGGWSGRVGEVEPITTGSGSMPKQTLSPPANGPRTDGKKTSDMPRDPSDGATGEDKQSGDF